MALSGGNVLVDVALVGASFADVVADDIIIWNGDSEEEYIRRVGCGMQVIKARGVKLNQKNVILRHETD
jgi:hypothetical protein